MGNIPNVDKSNFSSNKISQNILWLYIITGAKIILPLITLPYLTRVLSVEIYGLVLYIKSLLIYARITIEYGFSLSAVKILIQFSNNKNKQSQIISNVLLAQFIIGIISFSIFIAIALINDLILNHYLLALLFFIPVLFEAFLLDPLFRAIEKMHILSVRFILSQVLIVLLTISFIEGDSDVILLPLFELGGALIAAVFSFVEANKLGYSISVGNILESWEIIKKSTIYFISNLSLTAFNALNTIVIGTFLDSSSVAFWSIAMQIVGGIQMLYSPIINGIYPQMIATRNLKIIYRCLSFFLPILIIGCALTYYLSDLGIDIIAGEKYNESSGLLRIMIPVLFFGFLSMLYGWPTLGAIGKQKLTTITTLIATSFQFIGLFILVVTDYLTLFNIGILRSCTEFILFSLRFTAFIRYYKLFNYR